MKLIFTWIFLLVAFINWVGVITAFAAGDTVEGVLSIITLVGVTTVYLSRGRSTAGICIGFTIVILTLLLDWIDLEPRLETP